MRAFPKIGDPNMGVSENWGTLLWGPYIKDPTI